MNFNLAQLGSKTAKGGFKMEQEVVDRFNNWQNDKTSQQWLQAMNYDLDEVDEVKAYKVTGQYKADVQVEILIKLKTAVNYQNLQVKLVSNPTGFNQIDKRWVDSYADMWSMPSNVIELFKYFSGENQPKIAKSRDPRRMFADEFMESEKKLMLDFLEANRTLIMCDILKGRGKLSAEWMLVILKKKNNYQWSLKPINFVLNHYSQGDTKITPRGSFKIGKITLQRKGGDAGRASANMLQFKANPAELINL